MSEVLHWLAQAIEIPRWYGYVLVVLAVLSVQVAVWALMRRAR